MRALGALGLAILLLGAGPGEIRSAEAEADREAEIRVVLADLDRALAAVQRDIDSIETWVADPDVVFVELDGAVVPFDLDQLDDLLPLARNLIAGEPEMVRLLSERDERIAVVVAILEATPDETLWLAAETIKAAIRQDQDEKRQLGAARLAALEEESTLVDELIDALQAELDTIVAGEPASGSGAFPPAWLTSGDPSALATERFGGSPPAREPDFTVNHRATISEPCWTLDDGLHWCYRDAYGWVSVHQSVDDGLRWFSLEDRSACDLVVDSRVETADGVPLSRGHYACPGLEGFEFTTTGY